jgi:hypothetical protein
LRLARRRRLAFQVGGLLDGDLDLLGDMLADGDADAVGDVAGVDLRGGFGVAGHGWLELNNGFVGGVFWLSLV